MPFQTPTQPLLLLKICKFIVLQMDWVHLTNIYRLLTIKGAPDVLIGRCSKFVGMDGESKPLDESTRAAIDRTKDYWSSQGKRVILLARKVLFKDNIRSQPTSSHFEDEVMDHARSGLTLVGLVGIVDPPRDEIPSVVRILRGAGIRIFMVSSHEHRVDAILIQSGHWRLRFDSSSYCSRMRDNHKSI
jgi:magnesium-transporting ATPase (P-type)